MISRIRESVFGIFFRTLKTLPRGIAVLGVSMTARVGDWLKTQWQSNRGWLIALTVVVVLGLLGWGWVWSGGDDQVTRMDRLTGFAQLIGGSALLLGLVFTWRTVRNSENTFQQTRRSQDSDRFFKAVEQLGSGTADVRCGAIYSI